MRTWGRVGQVNGLGGTWTEVTTDANGYNDAVYLTTLIQCLKLNLGESPFFANYGTPAEPSVLTQVQPDYYVLQTQQQFAKFFGSLIISKTQPTKVTNPAKPTYSVNVVTQQGSTLKGPIPT
jgi:hypothetical protein